MNTKIDKASVIGLVATLVGLAGTLLTSVANKKQMDAKIAEEVQKALKNK